MKKAAKIIVKGTVQGIFFKQFVKEHADNLKLVGFIRRKKIIRKPIPNEAKFGTKTKSLLKND